MSQSDLLDLLLGLILVLVALIGLWQGIVRTLLFLAGSLLGSELALWWSDNVGDLLADWFPLSIGTGRFVAATGLIVATMILVGSGFSPLIWRYPRDWRNRAGGLLSGIALGALTLGLILRYYFIFLQDNADAALGDTRIASALWSDFHWVVAAAALTLVAMVILGWILGPPEPDHSALLSQARPQVVPSRSDHRTPPPPPPRPDAYSSLEQAPPIPKTYVASADESLYAGPATNGPVRVQEFDVPNAWDDLEPAAEAPARLESVPEYGTQRATASDTVSFATEEPRERRESAGICPNCGMLLRSGDAYCPDCGFPVES